MRLSAFCGVVLMAMAFGAAAEEPVTVTDPKEIIAAIPENLLPPREDQWTHGHAAKVDAWLQANYSKRPARLKLVFLSWKDGGRRIANSTAERRGAFPVHAQRDITFSKSMEREVPVKRGERATVIVAGPATYSFVLLEPQSQSPFVRLTITMKDPEIVK